MNVITRVLDWLSEKAAPSAVVGTNRQPQYPDRNYYGLSEYGYKTNAVVYAGISKLSTSFASVPLKVLNAADESEVKNHPTATLWSRPNPFQGRFEFAEAAITYLAISGNTFIVKYRAAGRKVKELWLLRPDIVKIHPSPDNFVDHYSVSVDGREYGLPAEDVLHVRLPNAGTKQEDLYWGASPLLSAIKAIGTDNEAFDYANTVISNHGVPITLLLGEAGKVWKAEDKIRFQEGWVNRFGKSNRTKYPALVEGVREAVQLGYNLDQLAFAALTSLDETRILAALGVPPVIAGVQSGLDASTYANYETARDSFWHETIIPHLSRFAEAINNDPDLKPIGENVAAQFDLSNVPAMQKAETEKEARARAAVQAGIITVNEYREKVGLPKDDKRGDVYLRGISTIEVPFNEEEPEPEALPENTDKPADQAGADDAAPVPPPSGKSAPVCSCGHNHGAERETKSAAVRDALKLLRHAMGRNAIADKYADRLIKILRKEGKLESAQIEQIYDALSSADDDESPLSFDAVGRVVAEVEACRAKWSMRLAEGSRPVFIDLAAAAGTQAGELIGVSFDIDNSTTVDYLKQYAFQFADKYGKTSAQDVRDVLLRANTEGMTPRKAKLELISRMRTWADSDTAQSRAEMIARTEVIRCANAGAKAAYKQAGVKRVQWLAVDDSCPYCLELASRPPIAIEEVFAKVGDELQGDDEEGNRVSMSVSYEDIENPPAHPNCRCAIVASLED